MRSIGSSRYVALLVAFGLAAAVIAVTLQPADTIGNAVYGCFQPDGIQTSRKLQETVPTCSWPNHAKNVTTGEDLAVGTTTTPTTQPPTTQPPTTIATTTTTQPPTGAAFLSYPHQSGRQTFTGSNVVVANRSYVGFTAGACLTVSNVTGSVWIHDVDFDGCGGAIFLINVLGTVTIENVRARNTGNGSIGSGQGNVVQLNNTYSCNGVIRNVNAYGGDTEDMLSVFKSGGCDSAHPFIVENNHLESPLSGPLAWSSGSGTCINVADADDLDPPAPGHDVIVRNNTLLNCGAVGLQMNRPLRVAMHNNIVYGAARTTSNVGISQWSSHPCSGCLGNSYSLNRVWWVKANGSASPWWLSGTAQVSIDTQSKTQDPSTPQVHVVL